MMRFVENMLEEVACLGTTDATIGENTVSFKTPYRVPILRLSKSTASNWAASRKTKCVKREIYQS